MHLNLRRFLKKLDNPLNNDELLKEAIKGYSKRNSRYLSFSGIENKECEIDEKSKEEFELYVFYKWKESMLSAIKNIKEDVVKNHQRDDILIKNTLIKYLSEYNPKSIKEIYDYFNGNNNRVDERYLDFLKDNLYSTIEKHGVSKTYSSYSIMIDENKRIDSKHKLMINVDPKYLYKFASLFMKKCEELNLPYSFSLNDLWNITNQFEINSDTNRLYTYIELLEKLKEEHKEEFENNIKQPPILSSHIDNWIGYISNTKNINSSSEYNNSEVRVKLFSTVLNKFNLAWTKAHINKDVIISNKSISYKEFFSELLYNELLIELNNDIKNTKDEKDCIITKKDLESEEVNRIIKEMINKNMDYILENLTNLNNFDETKLASIETRKKDVFITTDKDLILKALVRQPYILSKQSADFIDKFREKIKLECKRFKIIPEKITLDEKVWDELTDKEIEDRKLLHERLVKYRHVYK